MYIYNMYIYIYIYIICIYIICIYIYIICMYIYNIQYIYIYTICICIRKEILMYTMSICMYIYIYKYTWTYAVSWEIQFLWWFIANLSYLTLRLPLLGRRLSTMVNLMMVFGRWPLGLYHFSKHITVLGLTLRFFINYGLFIRGWN